MCVGFGRTKTLAKLANHLAKKQAVFNSVCDTASLTPDALHDWMRKIPVSEVWGVGKRIAIQETRKMVRAILNNGFEGTAFTKDPVFGFEVPNTCPGVDAKLLNPREMWADKDAYDAVKASIGEKFKANFAQFRGLVSPEVANAGP